MYGVGMSQEIPATFTLETGWPHVEECALVTSISMLSEWPLQIRRLHPVLAGVSAVSICGRWPKFLADNHLGIGVFLTFEVVDTRRLVVAIHTCGAPGELAQSKRKINGDTCDAGDIVEPPPTKAGGIQQTQSPLLPETPCDERPHFSKKLRKTHTLKNDSSRLVSGTYPL